LSNLALKTRPRADRNDFQGPSTDLVVEGLGKTFGDGPPVLRDISFSITRGESVSLIGSNGAGKSTLLRCLIRLLEPERGKVDLLGHDLLQLGGRRLRSLRSRIGLVWQRHNIVPRLSVLTNVIHGALGRSGSPRNWFQGLASRAVREEAMHCLELVGLTHLAGRRADSLSGGETQRASIARALMQRPLFMMADEPVASLDPRIGREVMELFAGLVNERGLTLVFTSHDLDCALSAADRVLGLQNGRIELDERARDLGKEELAGLYA
jgi:phosphonate transport system ATP-binding protein